ncbi:TPA: hypothetical protein ACSVZR_003914 [Bacillus cereus]
MKIEVGDIVNTRYSRNVEVLDVTPGVCNKSEYRVWFINDFGDRTNALIENCTLVKKGEKKMKVYKGIEAHDLMSDGKLMLGSNGFVYKMEDGLIYSCESIEKPWMDCSFNINQFLLMTFTEYKEPLKYKVGDKVLVEVEITRVEPDAEYPYTIARRPYAKETDIKGIDE